jgi:hypothetical protein
VSSDVEMTLPRPTEKLVDCMWLPRILAKARLFAASELDEEYASRFCHVSGVDGQFIAFFDLTRENLLAVSSRSDEEAGDWFCSSSLRESKIPEWNQIAVNLGRQGFPMAERLPVALSTTYGHLADRNLETVFQVLEADEEDSP